VVGGVFIHNFPIGWQEVIQERSLSKAHVIIYSRPGCHLCDEAKAVMQNAGCSASFTLEEINIESDKELLRKYQYDIPVVLIDGVEAFRHRVTANDFKRLVEPSTDYTESA
jgi:glutaredoxin